MSSLNSASLASSPLVRKIKPPESPWLELSRANFWSLARRLSRCSNGIFWETPICWSCGRNTNKRPAMLICEDKRAPLVPIGSLMTCTIKDWPSKTCFSIGKIGAGLAWSESACRAATLLIKSATCKKAALSKPMSIKADCMPGRTRATLPI